MQLNKPFTDQEYADFAVYCNENKYEIIDQGEYLEAVPTVQTAAEKASDIRKQRKDLINFIKWRVERYKTQKRLGVATADSEETYIQILQYLQYLRDIPLNNEFPDVTLLSFEEWQQQNQPQSETSED